MKYLLLVIAIFFTTVGFSQRGFDVTRQIQKCKDSMGNDVSGCWMRTMSNGKQYLMTREFVPVGDTVEIRYRHVKADTIVTELTEKMPTYTGTPVVSVLEDTSFQKRVYTFINELGDTTIIEDTDVRITADTFDVHDYNNPEGLGVFTENNYGDLYLVQYQNGVALYSYPGTGNLFDFEYFWSFDNVYVGVTASPANPNSNGDVPSPVSGDIYHGLDSRLWVYDQNNEVWRGTPIYAQSFTLNETSPDEFTWQADDGGGTFGLIEGDGVDLSLFTPHILVEVDWSDYKVGMRTETSNYTVDSTTDMLIIAGLNCDTITLSSTTAEQGDVFYVKDIDVTDFVTMVDNNSATIDGFASYTTVALNKVIAFLFDGTNWLIFQD